MGGTHGIVVGTVQAPPYITRTRNVNSTRWATVHMRETAPQVVQGYEQIDDPTSGGIRHWYRMIWVGTEPNNIKQRYDNTTYMTKDILAVDSLPAAVLPLWWQFTPGEHEITGELEPARERQTPRTPKGKGSGFMKTLKKLIWDR